MQVPISSYYLPNLKEIIHLQVNVDECFCGPDRHVGFVSSGILSILLILEQTEFALNAPPSIWSVERG